jgi:hypothetical protein
VQPILLVSPESGSCERWAVLSIWHQDRPRSGPPAPPRGANRGPIGMLFKPLPPGRTSARTPELVTCTGPERSVPTRSGSVRPSGHFRMIVPQKWCQGGAASSMRRWSIRAPDGTLRIGTSEPTAT